MTGPEVIINKMLKIKKQFNITASILCLFLMCALSSCGDDKSDEPDIESPDIESEVSIIGEWRCDFSDGYQILKFDKYGTYTLSEIDFASGNWSETGKWTIDNKTLILEYFEDGGGKEIYSFISLSNTKMTLHLDEYWEDDYHGYGKSDDIKTWIRVE